MATRDRLALLKDAVASVQAQTLADWELVVVDDASSDGTEAWLTAYPDPRVRHLRLGTHVERSAARNRGVAAASGRYLLFLDDDDRLLPTALQLLLRAAADDPDAVAVVGGYSVSDDRGNRRRASSPRRRARRSHWRDALFGAGVNLVGRALVRTDAIRDLGGFTEDLTFAEDWDLWLRLTKRADVVSIPDVVFDYALAPRPMSSLDARTAMQRIVESHMTTLDVSEKRIATRMIEVRNRHGEASDALSALEFRAALRGFVRAIASYPSVLSSPVVRPQLVRGLGKACVGVVIGRRGSMFVRRLASGLRRATGRDAWSSLRMERGNDETNVC